MWWDGSGGEKEIEMVVEVVVELEVETEMVDVVEM